MDNNKPRKRNTIDLSQEDESAEVKSTLVVESKTSNVSPLDVSSSPLMEAMIERKGGDDFLYENKPSESQNSNQQPVESTSQQPEVNNNPTPVQTATSSEGPKEFTFNPSDNIPPSENGTPGAENGASPSAESNSIPSEIGDESSKMIADMLLEGFGMVAPEMADRYSKINEGQIRKLERDGKIQNGLVEIVKETNKNNKGAVRLTSEQKNLIRKPLMKVLEIQGVKASPESMLVIAIIAVCLMLFIQARSIKTSNDDMVKSWMDDHSRSKKLETENDKLRVELEELKNSRFDNQSATVDNIPYAEVEHV